MRRRVNTDQIETDADKTMLHVSKAILDSERFEAIARIDRQTREYVKSRALPFPFKRGMHLMPVGLIKEVEGQLEVFEQERQRCITLAMQEYPLLVEASRSRLKSLFNANDYPPTETLRQAYRRELRYLTLSVPGVLKQVSPDLYARESQQAEDTWYEATLSAQMTLRQELGELVNRAVARLQPREDGKRGGMRESLLDNFLDFLRLFQARNLADDAALETLVEQCQQLMTGVGIFDIRTNPTVRDEIRQGLTEVQARLQTLPSAAGLRKIRFAADSEA